MTVDPIINGVHAFGELHRSIRDDKGRLHLGSVDPLTAANWSRECGAAIGTKEFAAYAKKKLLSGEFAKYKINHRKVIF